MRMGGGGGGGGVVGMRGDCFYQNGLLAFTISASRELLSLRRKRIRQYRPM